ncbi:hypothetical protein [Mariprofundus ferrooxydans]|uniref:hypothetical protein n=1 Tax=Mariprofundus ferrooxydans TaxID=314344 RepID=UPI0012DC03A3|nr:hypothetical protein [Mariprofundus ferrooxydans]
MHKFLITHEEFAKSINKNHRTIYNILSSTRARDNSRKAQLPPFRRCSNRFVISVEELNAWLAEQPAANARIQDQDK